MPQEQFNPKVCIHPVTGDRYQRARWSSRIVTLLGNGNYTSSLGVLPTSPIFSLLHSEIARDTGVEEVAFQVATARRAVKNLLSDIIGSA